MSKKKVDTKKLYFLKAKRGYSYHAGQVYEVSADQAERFIEDGTARSPKQTLPKDFPFRKELIAAGLETVAEVENAKDLKEVKGIGEASEKEIAEYLAKK